LTKFTYLVNFFNIKEFIFVVYGLSLQFQNLIHTTLKYVKLLFFL